MSNAKTLCKQSLLLLALGCAAQEGAQASPMMVSGDPSQDTGWTLNGHSLAQGTYVKGTANYGFNAYSAGFAVTAGSNLEIDDPAHPGLSWLVGDKVLGVGGQFDSNITPAAAGWGALANFAGNGINSLLPTSAPYSGPKLQAKFGTANATWTTSTSAPDGGNGNSSSSAGGGRVQIRTSGYFQTGTPTPGQTEPWTWDGNSGQLLPLDKSSHILWDIGIDISPSKYIARMIWQWDNSLKRVTSWELLLNVSLLERQAPANYAGLFPAPGDLAILTVQNGDGAYTDARVRTAAASADNTIAEPPTLALAGAGFMLAARRRRRATA